jgi:hypothetical protein
MPICEACGTAYLEGESHVCVPKSRALRVLGMGIAGFAAGGLTGFYLLTIIFCLVLNVGNQCGLIGAFIGLPLGAVIGALVGARFAAHRGHDRR